jgi:hypothetical protein
MQTQLQGIGDISHAFHWCIVELLDLFHVSYIHGTFFCGLYPQLQKEDKLCEKSIVFNVDGIIMQYHIKNGCKHNWWRLQVGWEHKHGSYKSL